MSDLPRCDHTPGLGPWLRDSIGAHLPLDDQPLVEVPLSRVLGEIPVLLDPPETARLWSGRLGLVTCWELRAEDGSVLARLATAPQSDLTVPQEIVTKHPRSYHQSAIGAGPGFLEQNPHSYDEARLRDGPHFNGYILGDDLVGCLNVGRGSSLFLVAAQFPGLAVADYEGYWDGEALLARLDMPAA